GERDLLLVGGREPIGPRLANVSRGWLRPGVAQDLSEVDVRDPFSVLSLLQAQGAALEALGANATRQTDDLTGLESSAPRALYDRSDMTRWLTQSAELQRIQPWLQPDMPETLTQTDAAAGAVPWRNRAVMLLHADAPSLAYDAAVHALELDPVDP